MNQPSRPTRIISSGLVKAGEELSLMGHGLLHLLSLQNLIAGLKTLLWLGPLTLLIWVYAEEGQNVSSDGEIVSISVHSSDPKMYVELRMPNDEVTVTADLTGPAGQLAEVHRKIIADAQQTVSLTVPASFQPGLHDPDTAQLLMANPIFASSNVQVGKCKPPRITVYVDPYEEREMEVKKPQSLKNINTALFDPPTVHVRAPSEVFKNQVRLEAQLSEAANVGKSGDQRAIVHVKLVDVPAGVAKAVTYDRESVNASFTVPEDAQDSFTYPYLQILTLAPPALLNKYNIEFDEDKDTLPNVRVIGPAEKIKALKLTAETRPDELPKPRAILEVKGEDRLLAGQPTFRPRQLKFDQLPDASIRINPDDEKKVVSFRVVDRTASQ